MASVVMYEILTNIRLHPLLMTAGQIPRLSDEDQRWIDELIREGYAQCIRKRIS